jgi:hypothetical protein
MRRYHAADTFARCNLMAPSPLVRWDAYPSARFSDSWNSPDFEGEAFRRGEAEGLLHRSSENGWRTFVRAAGGSGIVDRVRDGVDVSVVNCVLPAPDRRTCDADESLILLYASLSCDLVYRVEGQPAIAMNRPAFTLVSVPKGLPMTVDIQGGVRPQRLFGAFRHAALAKAFGLKADSLPEMIRDEAADRNPSIAEAAERAAISGDTLSNCHHLR